MGLSGWFSKLFGATDSGVGGSTALVAVSGGSGGVGVGAGGGGVEIQPPSRMLGNAVVGAVCWCLYCV